jgi:hypothetical protein
MPNASWSKYLGTTQREFSCCRGNLIHATFGDRGECCVDGLWWLKPELNTGLVTEVALILIPAVECIGEPSQHIINLHGTEGDEA